MPRTDQAPAIFEMADKLPLKKKKPVMSVDHMDCQDFDLDTLNTALRAVGSDLQVEYNVSAQLGWMAAGANKVLGLEGDQKMDEQKLLALLTVSALDKDGKFEDVIGFLNDSGEQLSNLNKKRIEGRAYSKYQLNSMAAGYAAYLAGFAGYVFNGTASNTGLSLFVVGSLGIILASVAVGVKFGIRGEAKKKIAKLERLNEKAAFNIGAQAVYKSNDEIFEGGDELKTSHPNLRKKLGVRLAP